MRLNAFEVENIRVAALLHDLGKVGVSEAVLQKVTALTAQEKVRMRQHAWLAVNMLERVGYRVKAVDSGEKAVEYLKKESGVTPLFILYTFSD